MNTILLDLDGTLLPMDQDVFTEIYFKKLAVKGSDLGFDPQLLVKAVWSGTKAMVNNDGKQTNQQRFWDVFSEHLGEEARLAEAEFEKFYLSEFNQLKAATSPTPKAKECVKLFKEKGYSLVLATNPIFPRVATLQRIAWAGLDPEDFQLITTYENSRYCKPNLVYYQDILEKMKVTSDECLMIGNDLQEDMCVTKLGIEAYLLKDCLIAEACEKDNAQSQYRQGSFSELLDYARELPDRAF